MLPNRFPDRGEAPLYNTIDATMWFFVAVYKYALESRDYQLVLNEILPVMADILGWHKRGTRYTIHMDRDSLLTGGVEGDMLTWMDACAGDWVVTPRIGKSVEVHSVMRKDNISMILSMKRRRMTCLGPINCLPLAYPLR